MSTAIAVESKYHLKNLHAEIDLFDRRLAHLLKYDVFDSETARAAAVRKLKLRREPLVQTARRLAADGVEFKESELPRSFRSEDSTAADPGASIPLVKVEQEVLATAPTENRSARRQGSPYAGTSLDSEKNMQQYLLLKKAKA